MELNHAVIKSNHPFNHWWQQRFVGLKWNIISNYALCHIEVNFAHSSTFWCKFGKIVEKCRFDKLTFAIKISAGHFMLI